MRRNLPLLSLLVAALGASADSAAPPPIVAPEMAFDQPLDGSGQEVAVGFDGTNYLLVWAEPTATGDDLVAARVSASGTVLDAVPFVISAAAGEQSSPAVAFDGTNWLVAWQDHRSGQYFNVYVARVDRAGDVLDPAGIPVAPQTQHQLHPAVDFDGARWLVAWSDHRDGTNWSIYAARVGASGTVLDGSGFAVSTASLHQKAPALAFDGANHLVVWQDQRSGTPAIYGARVTPSAQVLDPAGIAIGATIDTALTPAVAFGGGEYLVAWEAQASGATDLDVLGRRMSPAGALLDAAPFLVAGGPGNQQAPAVVFDGQGFVVAWEDSRSGTEYDVYGARVSPSGAVRDAAGFEIAAATQGGSLALGPDGAGRALAAYDAVNALLPATPRLRALVLTDWATLGVAKAGRGGGGVASAPSGIDCGPSCTARFDAPTAVTLTAAPDGTSAWGGWSGACSGSATTCTVTMDAARSVGATFLATFPVTVSLDGAGSVASADGAIACGSACSARYVEGSAVALSAKGVSGSSVFGSWSGACSGTGACTVTVDQAKTVGATFLPAYTMTVSPMGAGGGTIAGGGVSCTTGTEATCSADVAAGSSVTLTATPDASSIFAGWSGACSGTSATCTVSMGGSRIAYANFQPAKYTLSASPVGTGRGTVSGGGVSCTTGTEATCSAKIPNTTPAQTVTLTATPDADSIFAGWTSACSGTATTCTVSMSGDRVVYATFQPAKYTIAVNPVGAGGGTVTGGGVACTTGATSGCSAQVANTTPAQDVTLTATPDANSIFAGWSGACSGTSPTCTVSMGGDRAVYPTFQPAKYTLTVNPVGAGAGTVSGGGVSCTTGSGTGCSVQVPNTTPAQGVTLTATPDANSIFAGWSGACSGTATTCTVPMSGDRAVYATFQPARYTLTANPIGAGGGTVTGGGLSCSGGSAGTCSVRIANTIPAQSVTLTATPDASSVFAGWSGACSGTAATCTVSMDGDRAVYATFQPAKYTLTVNPIGAGAGTVTGGGVSCTTGSGTGCSAAIANTSPAQNVTLTATPDASSVFSGWSGACSGTAPTCTVSMSGDRAVYATFQPARYTLSVSPVGAGAGTVTGGGVSCTTGSGTGCSAQIANTLPAQDVTLTATPDASSVFAGWSGACSGTAPTCTVSMSGDRAVYASFQPARWTLSVSPIGAGAGTVTGGGVSCTTGSATGCTAAIANTTPAQTVTLTATPDASSVFAGWSGACSGTAATCTLSMTGDRAVWATFQPARYTLTVNPIGAGGGTVSGGGIDCAAGAGPTCSVAVANTSPAQTVTLTATPDASSVFAGWSGACSGTAATCTVSMSGDRSVWANFQPARWTLSVTPTGGGVGTIGGGGLSCTTGSGPTCSVQVANTSPAQTVNLTATPDASSVFAGWSGACSGTAATCTVSMTGDRSVWATFQPATYTLTVSLVGSGVGTVAGGAVSCTTGIGPACSAEVANTTPAQTVTLTATPNASSTFAGWSGACSGTGATCTVSMTGARGVWATFNAQ